MKIYKPLIIIILFILTSCFKDVEFRGIDKEHKLFFQCMPGAQDTTVFWLRSTFPVSVGISVKPVTNPQILFYVNGKEVEVIKNEGVSSTFPNEAFFAVEPLKQGDRLEFRAEAEGFPPIASKTVVPYALEDVAVTAKLVPSPDPEFYTAHQGRGVSENMSKEVAEFNITFKDEPHRKDFYMVEVIEYIDYQRPSGEQKTYSNSVAYIMPKEAVDSPMAPQRNDIMLVSHKTPWNTINDFYGEDYLCCLFDDKDFDGTLHTMKLQVNRLNAFEEFEFKYKVFIFRVSEEYYKYAKAWHNAYEAEGSELPSSSPFMAYDNIDGGSGIFAGTQLYATDTLIPVK